MSLIGRGVGHEVGWLEQAAAQVEGVDEGHVGGHDDEVADGRACDLAEHPPQ
jgi:hypothetical protein